MYEFTVLSVLPCIHTNSLSDMDEDGPEAEQDRPDAQDDAGGSNVFEGLSFSHEKTSRSITDLICLRVGGDCRIDFLCVGQIEHVPK